jgi:hypothetical protein
MLNSVEALTCAAPPPMGSEYLGAEFYPEWDVGVHFRRRVVMRLRELNTTETTQQKILEDRDKLISLISLI